MCILTVTCRVWNDLKRVTSNNWALSCLPREENIIIRWLIKCDDNLRIICLLFKVFHLSRNKTPPSLHHVLQRGSHPIYNKFISPTRYDVARKTLQLSWFIISWHQFRLNLQKLRFRSEFASNIFYRLSHILYWMVCAGCLNFGSMMTRREQ